MTFDNFSFSVSLSNSEPQIIKVAKIVFLAPGRLRNASIGPSHPQRMLRASQPWS